MPRRKFDAWIAHPQAKVAVVGASGWIGRAFAHEIVAAGLSPQRLRLFASQPRAITLHGKDFQSEALTADTRLGEGNWLVIHAGIIGADRVIDGDLSVVRQRNETFLQQVFAMTEGAGLQRLVMMSSGAAHKPGEGSPAKAAYSQLKRDQESAVQAWSLRTGHAVLLPRVFNLGGPYINHVRNYALGDFILALAQSGKVTVGAADPVWRSYVHVLEMAGLLLSMAIDPSESPEPFDIAGSEDVELGYLAKRVAEVMDLKPVIERAPAGGGPGDFYLGEGRRYQAALAASGAAPILLNQIVADTVRYLRETGEIS
jgi:nucleoside-diphosphate-sugar epimerase